MNELPFLLSESPVSSGDIRCGDLKLVCLQDDGGPSHYPAELQERP